MAQAVLLKTDAMIAGNAGQNSVKNHTQNSDNGQVESFSSTLDKQVSQQNTKTDKIREKDEKSAKSDNKVQKESEIKETKSGKSLPDKVTDSSDKLDDAEEIDPTEQADPTLATEMSLNVPTEDIHLEGESDESSIIVDDAPKQEAVMDLEFHGKVIASSEETNTKPVINVVADAKKTIAGLTDEDDVSLEQKQLASSLRSDILNALQKKPVAESEKLTSVIDQKAVASSTLIPIVKEGLSEEQKMIALAKITTLEATSLTGNAPERAVSVSTTALAAVTAGGNTPISSAVSSGQPTLDIQPALQSEAWGRVLSSRVVWMAREGVQQASLKLNPANMGPVEVKLHMHNDQANISFIAQHATTRDALEQALPRLRESFQENGMQLAHADVSQQSFSQAGEQSNNAAGNGAISGELTMDDSELSTDAEQVIVQDVELGLSVFA